MAAKKRKIDDFFKMIQIQDDNNDLCHPPPPELSGPTSSNLPVTSCSDTTCDSPSAERCSPTTCDPFNMVCTDKALDSHRPPLCDPVYELPIMTCSDTADATTHDSSEDQLQNLTCDSPTTSNITPVTAVQGKSIIEEVFGDQLIHNYFLCPRKGCINVSPEEISRNGKKKFPHGWLNNKKNWWLCYVEGKGMYCMLCAKHKGRNIQNKQEIFAEQPSVRFRTDALERHSVSSSHKAVVSKEMMQRFSVFHKELEHKKSVNKEVCNTAFMCAYYLMKEHIPNSKLSSIIQLMQEAGLDDMKYFTYSSSDALREIFLTIGQTVKERVLKKCDHSNCYGIMTDEVCDIGVVENLVTFIQYFNAGTGIVETAFLSIQDVLSKFDAPNAEAITTCLLDELKADGLDIKHLTGFASDGASVMVGKNTGVATRLKQLTPSMLNVHCICHRLALACTDTNKELKAISNMELILQQLWQYFENSPKRMARYLKIQSELMKITLPDKKKKSVGRKLKKACKTRWLSFDQSVSAIHRDFEAVLQTLNVFEDHDATACGLLRKLQSINFIATIYILKDILPILSKLSKSFQANIVSFSQIPSMLNATKQELQKIKEDLTPLNKLQADIDCYSNLSSEVKMTTAALYQAENLLKNYVTALINNLDCRFNDTIGIIKTFGVFDPFGVPPKDSPEFKNYGNSHITILANHYFGQNKDAEVKLQAEWMQLKYYMIDVKKDILVSEMPINPTQWFIIHILRKRADMMPFFSNILFIAEAAATLPMSSAWPERGASQLKLIKTNSRSRLKTDMLEAAMQVAINGPNVSACSDVISASVKKWLAAKPRRKVCGVRREKPSSKVSSIVMRDSMMQTEDVTLERPNIETTSQGIQTDSQDSQDIANYSHILNVLGLDEEDSSDSSDISDSDL